MLDIKFIRENPSLVQQAAKDKGIEVNIDHLLHMDARYRELATLVQKLREERNVAAKEQNIEKGKEIKEKLEKEEQLLGPLKEELEMEILKVPNPAADDVKVGEGEKGNEIIRKFKEPTQFQFTPKDHLDLGETLNIIDTKRGAKVSGARFAYLKDEGAQLELALIQYSFETLLKEGFTPIFPPVLIKTETMKGLGYMEFGGDEEMFLIPKDDLLLIGTAEHSIVAMHKDEVFSKKELPKRYVGFSTAFRREAGSYGKDTKGILRMHQFDKVEMVSFTTEENDENEHNFLLSLEEKLFQSLEIPYQVIKMGTGDLGFPASRKFDLEAWMPGQQKYREVTSTSTTTDFQARRLNIKYQEGAEKKFVHILNGTAFAIGRTIIAILENYQQSDGSVVVPDVLQKYLGKEKISPK